MNDDFDDDGGDYTVEQLQPEDMLADEELGDVLDRGYSPPDRPPHDYDKDNFAHESLDERLPRRCPTSPTTRTRRRCGLPVVRRGRRTARQATRGPDEGVMSDDDEQMLGTDVGIDGAGASAEGAAVHVITPEDLL